MKPLATPRTALILAAVLLLGPLAPLAEAQPASVEDETDGLARSRSTSTGIAWHPVSNDMGLLLTVSGPDDFRLRRAGEPGAAVSFSIFREDGHLLPEGSYTYQLRPIRAPKEREGREAGTALARHSTRSPEVPSVQSGSFAIRAGRLETAGVQEPGVGKAAPSGGTGEGALATKDQVIADDLVVQGSLCAGFDCVNGESFGFDTIRLKENNLRIKFEDTSSSTGFPTRDWQLTANDSASGGLEKFSIDDVDGGRTPFTLEAGAPSHSLYVDDGGRVGLGTATPVLEAHVLDGDTPGLRLEQDASAGFEPQTWDVAGNETNFFVRDATNGSLLPFRIFPGAPSSSLTIRGDGSIGLGDQTPDARLDLEASAPPTLAITHADQVAADELLGTLGFRGGFSGGESGDAASLVAFAEESFAAGAHGAGLRLRTTAAGSSTASDRLTVRASGEVGIGTTDPVDLLEVEGGNIRVTGGSFIDDGKKLKGKGPDYVFEADYELMPLEELEEFVATEKHLPEVQSAEEMVRDGIDLTELQLVLLEKIEELTLYTIRQQEQLRALEEKNARLEEKLARESPERP